MLLREVLFHKGHEVFSCQPEESLPDIVQRLVAHNIGSLVVLNDQGTMVGIITERDILRACARGAGCIMDSIVADCMIRNPILGSAHDDISQAMAVMTDKRIRHLPVLDEEELIGMISIGDLVKAQAAELSCENQFLKSYIQS